MAKHLGTLAINLYAIACSRDGGGSGRGQMSDKEYLERMSSEHKRDAPIAGAASMPGPGVAIRTENVPYADVRGRRVEGYLAIPRQEQQAKFGIIVIHEWWGLNDNIRSMADKLAGREYAALAVDLYGGKVAENAEQARKLMETSMQDPSDAEENLRQAWAFLSEEQKVAKVGTVGWCFGGGWSLNAAILLGGKVDATVVYYGRPVTDSERLKRIHAPILGFFGAEDQGIPVDSAREFERQAKALGKNVQIHVYDGAGHAFANPSGTNYRPEAAADAWEKTVAFFAKYLG